MNAHEPIDQALRILRIIVAAMMMGVFGLSVVAVLVGRQADPNPKLANIMLVLLAVMAVWELIAYAVVRASVLNRLRRRFAGNPPAEDPATELIGSFNSLTIIACALAEGLGLFGAVIMLITGAWAALAAPALALIVLTLQLPSEDKIARFVSGVTGQQWSGR
jgi:F0F1-type ATP synthase membrane subunit c/vacuolar-type H+-ATPase subunit K